VPRFTIPEDAIAIATFTHNGGSNFAVWTVDASGAETDLLVNTIGVYSGTVLFDEQGHSVAFSVEADGAWTAVIKPIELARAWNGATTIGGHGDDVVRVDPPTSGLSTTTMIHNGASNFAVWSYGLYSVDLLINEIGAYSGEVLLADATVLFEVTADGDWSMTAPQ
jgi:hypothetical protein